MNALNNEIFGRITENGDVAIFNAVDGDVVTKLDANVYPINSSQSARYEHPDGIVLTKDDTTKLKIQIEK